MMRSRRRIRNISMRHCTEYTQEFSRPMGEVETPGTPINKVWNLIDCGNSCRATHFV
jgi:hypothetical protein